MATQVCLDLASSDSATVIAKAAGADWPEGIDSTNRETYLSDAEFERVFGMQRDAFMGLPMWKRNGMKKQHKLF